MENLASRPSDAALVSGVTQHAYSRPLTRKNFGPQGVQPASFLCPHKAHAVPSRPQKLPRRSAIASMRPLLAFFVAASGLGLAAARKSGGRGRGGEAAADLCPFIPTECPPIIDSTPNLGQCSAEIRASGKRGTDFYTCEQIAERFPLAPRDENLPSTFGGLTMYPGAPCFNRAVSSFRNFKPFLYAYLSNLTFRSFAAPFLTSNQS